MFLLITLALISGNLIQAKELDTKYLDQMFQSLGLQLFEIKSTQFAVNEELQATKTSLNKVTNQLKDSKYDQFGMNEKMTTHVEQLIDAKLNQIDISELMEQLNDMKLNQTVTNEIVKELTEQLKDMKINQTATNDKMTRLVQELIDVKLNQNVTNEFGKVLTEQLMDMKLNQNAMNDKMTIEVQRLIDAKLNQTGVEKELTEQSKDMKINQTDLNELITSLLNQHGSDRFTPLPPNFSKLVGKKIKGFESLGPLSSASQTGNWNFTRNESWSDQFINRQWSSIMRGEGAVVYSGPIILPMKPHFIIQFLFFGSEMRHKYIGMQVNCLNIKHNRNLASQIPFKFAIQLRIQDNGFTEVRKLSFEMTNNIGPAGLADELLPSNMNWNRYKMPKDIEVIFL